MNTKSFFIYFFLFNAFLIGCEKNTIQYEYTMYRDGFIQFWREPMYTKYKDYLEDGEFELKTPEGRKLISGKYEDGYKVGLWKYHPTDSQTVTVNWAKYQSKTNDVSINYPTDWEIVESKTRPFQATFPTKSPIKEDKYFIILAQDKSTLDVTLEEYWNLYNQETHSNDSVKTHLLRKFSREDGDYYFSTYTLHRNNEEIFVFNFLGEINSKIYDITFSSVKEDVDQKYTIFLDMIRSLRIDNQRFFTPFEQDTQIIELEWPPKQNLVS